MIDIHTHMLPLIDDGSESQSQSLEMLKEAQRQGVTHLFVTPHYRFNYKSTPLELEKAFKEFCRFKDDNNIPIKLYLGQEVYIPKDFDTINKNEVLTLNETNHLLIEFSTVEKVNALDAVYEILQQGYVPIIGHVERYSYISLEQIIEMREMGCKIQVNADTVCRVFPFRLYKRTRKLLRLGLVDFIASDMHYERINYMAKAKKCVTKKYGKSYADKLFYENAKEIVGEK